MNRRPWGAAVALLVVVLLLVPTVETLQGGIGGLASDLARGDFHPFGQPFRTGPGSSPRDAFDTSLGGLSGSSHGNYLPGALDLPEAWFLDRDGSGGRVTIDYVFDPEIGAMKRLKVYDGVGDDGALTVRNPALRPVTAFGRPGLTYDLVFKGSFPIFLREGVPTPVYTVHPDVRVESYSTSPLAVLEWLKDGADTYHVRSDREGVVLLNVTYRAASSYFQLAIPSSLRVGDYDEGSVAPLPPHLRESAGIVLDRLGLRGETRVALAATRLVQYFNSFRDGDIPGPDRYPDLYTALALGGNGCCRHRAYAFMITALALGIPARVVVNEAHAFVEVFVPDSGWHQANLGGCGTYEVNNPNRYRTLLDAAGNPRSPADTRPPPSERIPTVIALTEAPDAIEKGRPFAVRGTVRVERPDGTEGAGVPSVQVDLYLNASKERPGVLAGSTTTDLSGEFSVQARVPRGAPAKDYHLVAHALPRREGSREYSESWSDPIVSVTSPTRTRVRAPAVEGEGAPVHVEGDVLDVVGAPVQGEMVLLFADGQIANRTRTDARGRFSVSAVFAQAGSHALLVQFPGTSHYGASNASATVSITRGALVVPPELDLVRGEPARLAGRLLLGGEGVANETVAIHWPGGLARAATDGNGWFVHSAVLPGGAPLGATTVNYSAPGVGVSKAQPARVLARPTLTPGVASQAPPSQPLAVTARLVDDHGKPLVGERVVLAVGDATWTQATNRTGVAAFEVPADVVRRGELTLEARYDGSPLLTPATGTASVRISSGSLFPGWASAALLVAGFAAVVAFLAWGARASWRRLTLRSLTGALPAMATRLRLRRETRFEVETPALAADLPGSAAAGDAFIVRIRLLRRARDGTETPLPRAPIQARFGAALLALRTDEEGFALHRAPPQPPGPFAVELRYRGSILRAPASHRGEVRVVEYRREIERGYRELLARAGTAGLDVGPSTTPREAQRRLLAAAPDAAEELDRLLTLVEMSSFSERPVQRDDYLAFRRALTRVDRDFGRRGDRPEAG